MFLNNLIHGYPCSAYSNERIVTEMEENQRTPFCPFGRKASASEDSELSHVKVSQKGGIHTRFCRLPIVSPISTQQIIITMGMMIGFSAIGAKKAIPKPSSR